MPKKVNSKFAFQKNIQAHARRLNATFSGLEQSVANIVLAQLVMRAEHLTDQQFYFKGGTSLLFRFGIETARTTQDIDMTIAADRERIESLILDLAGVRWNQFKVKGVKVVKTIAPSWVAEEKRLLKFKVQIAFGESEWRTVVIEATTDEFDSSNSSERLSGEILSEPFQRLGLEVPSTVPVMQTELQIAQKIHACLTPMSVRGHDLYDIYKMLEVSNVDITELARLVRQTFDSRWRHVWNTSFSPSEELKAQYLRETHGIDGTPNFEDALQTFSALLVLIDDAMSN